MSDNDLGRLIRTLKERCPNCNSVLQLRARKKTQLVRGMETTTETNYICCVVCDYEKGVKKKGKDHPNIDKTIWIDQEENKERYDKHNKPKSTTKRYGNSYK